MRIDMARQLAGAWVQANAEALPELRGAWIAGSTNMLPDDADLPASSDLDVMIVLEGGVPPVKLGKFRYEGVLLEVTYLAMNEVSSPEQVLGHYHLAGSLCSGLVISDPTGYLVHLQDAVIQGFAGREWVGRRCDMARETVLARLDAAAEDRAFEEQVMSWLFAAGGVPHMLLVAGLRNPTVRKRYVDVQHLLADVGHVAFYPELLSMIDPRGMTADHVSYHLSVLGQAFDAAASIVRTPFFFASDLSYAARSVSIGGSQELIDQGNHREAVFWIVATFARCQMVFHTDAPANLAGNWDHAFRDLLADLEIFSTADLLQRGEAIHEALPDVDVVAEAIIDVTTRFSRP